MNVLFVAKVAVSMRREISIVLVVMGVLFALPVVALFSMTDISALAESPKSLYTGTASANNTYTYGYCTFWAAKRREDVGKAIPNTWGDAHTWDDRAKADGYLVDHTPTLYAIMETDAGELGHVAFVESIGLDGSWTISQMNAPHWDMVSERTFTAADAAKYSFIH